MQLKGLYSRDHQTEAKDKSASAAGDESVTIPSCRTGFATTSGPWE